MNTPENQTPIRGLELHPDPITGEPGAHPVGTGVGAAAGGATGAAIGSLAGPIGTVVGTVIGAIAGGLTGKGVAESIDPSAEDAYWREQHSKQKYADDEQPFDAFAPAYRTGYMGYREGQTFEEREADLRMEYEGGPQKAEAEIADSAVQNAQANATPGTIRHDMTPLRWDKASAAARAAYERVRRGEASILTAD